MAKRNLKLADTDNEHEHEAAQSPAALAKRRGELDAFIRAQVELAANLKLERKAINEQMKAVIDEVNARGVNRKAFKAALTLHELESAEREEYGVSMSMIGRALGWPPMGEQIEMFQASTQPSTELPQGANAIVDLPPDEVFRREAERAAIVSRIREPADGGPAMRRKELPSQQRQSSVDPEHVE